MPTSISSGSLGERLVRWIINSLPFIPPCKDAQIASVTSGFQVIGEESVVIDTIVWKCPDGQIITKTGPALYDQNGNLLPLPFFNLLTSLQETNVMTNCDFTPCTATRTRDAGLLLPKSGHLLGHMSLVTDDRAIQNRLIETADGGISFVGISTDAHDKTEIQSFTATPDKLTVGEFEMAVGHLPARFEIGFEEVVLVQDGGDPMHLDDVAASIVTTFDPKSNMACGAIIRIRTGDRNACLFLTDFQEGLAFTTFALIVIGIGAVAYIADKALDTAAKSELKVKVKAPGGVEAEFVLKVDPGKK